MEEVVIQQADLKALVVDKLVGAEVSEEHAEVVADVLIHADLRGVSSHGVLRTEHYVKRMLMGGMNANPEFKVERKGSAGALFDGDNGMGHVITKEAMDEAIKLSKENGIGIVGVINSSHCGALSYYAEQAAKEDTISMVMTHTDSAVVPFGGAEPYFGTNPIAYGFPANKHKPMILDMATSNVAFGKVLHARETGKEIPDNWGVDEKGNPVTDPNLVKHLLPASGPKGYGLGLVVDVMTGVLTGSTFGPDIPPMYGDYNNYRQLSHVIVTIDPGLFIGKKEFLSNIDQMIDELHAVQPAEGVSSVMVPGEPEQWKEEARKIEGIPVPKSIYGYLKSQ
ncbi:ureidoglycolate dehydrogenase [Halobacillus karajensis]|uniref:Oxidoreductase YjmC n=1 Tax=Halobacillus karajensis TaxID=195088 RepID=A0A059NVN2_9BACI|nr:ureidoglycolate dehydrogenase [Halobacillus karajensis]CDQ18479.1 putative oxidoreductase YjmC [Halobacillus karajensis]CDQ23449.1 putative oxidoreductase YjmC [Halobacillus karajensis]CDQ26931.1 putative oxidoreductase YjmC [Halobacillus karajensis]